ncbi:S24 family peptidase [Flavobacterium sp. F-65]|jgi:SOS-response transcriptional repressor LexA|uniref:S24 family peptidase n=1 Tax=Flavobacterium pisciphilum TaxID=2893755 RepID=A0ABS8MSN8_9FLAO|nr:S24 family peptidase [Flavobacterium sp. F-65]MCC9071132.1 S24 family peptidase [Flavobacterium sp. F-65]
MNKYERLKNELETVGNGKMKAFGDSMRPILKSGSLLTFEKSDNYAIGDIVFCKVKGRYIDAHKIIKIDTNKGFLIANNKGFENGWTKIVYGKVIQGEYQNQLIYENK